MKNVKKWLSLSLAGAMLMGVLAGCGGGTSSTPAPVETGAAEATGEPAAVEQVLKYGTDTWPAGFDPHTISAIAATRVFNQVYETLIDFNPDMTFKGVLAESWENPDDVTYVFHLRQGVKFHNGREMTADDVVYSFQRVLGQTDYGDIGALGSSASYYGGIASIEATDDYTFVIKLKEASAGFLSLNIIAILPEGYEDQATAPVGTGPFKFVEYVPSQRVVLEKNPDYYDEDRMAQVDRVEFYIMTDSAAVVSALQSGTLDIASISADDAAVLEGQFDIYNSPQNMVQIFALNNEFEPFSKKEVRQAINYCIDKDQIIDSVFGGYGTKLYTNFSPVMEVYYNSDLEGSYDTDVAQAQSLMEQAGYADGFEFTVKVPANYQAHIDTAQIIAQQLQQINITMNIETIEWATWLEDVYTNANYEGTIIGLTGKLDPDDVLGRFESSYARNFYNYSNSEYDQLINDSVTELDEQTRIDNYKRCQEILTEDAVGVFICDPNLVVASRKDLKGYTFYPVTFHDMTKLYYEG